MKAVVFHDVGDIRPDAPEPTLQAPADAIIRLTCGTGLHVVRGSASGRVKGTLLGHEGVGTGAEPLKDAAAPQQR